MIIAVQTLKAVKGDPRAAGLVESPECADPDALDDDSEVLRESPEADNLEALNDPEEDEVATRRTSCCIYCSI